MDLGLQGKIAAVTGASRGIGAAIARELAQEGCAVAVAARPSKDLDAVVAEIRGRGGRALAVPADLRDAAAPQRLVDAVVAEFGRLDIVVGSAGATGYGDFLDTSDDTWADGFAGKFFGHMRLARAAWPHLKASRGSFVFISGLASRSPHANAPVGAAVNGALRSFTKALAERALPDGIRINTVCPGSIRTQRYARRVRMAQEAEGIDAAEYERRIVAKTAVTRIGEPEDIAGLVAFIVSRRGDFLHGAIIEMDGGQTKTA